VATKKRGKGAKPVMAHVTIRVPRYVLAFFKGKHVKHTQLMRDALIEYVDFYAKQR
jgi:hypothetical protein